MSILKNLLAAKPALISLSIGLSLLVGVVSAQVPSQKPLLSRDGGGVPPNIMLTMDDSGSMMFQHMPENTVYAGAFSVASPVGTQSVRMDPGDNATLAGFFIGTIAARPTSTNWRQKLLRSSDTNTIYYNPEVRYQPWALPTYPLPAATATNPAGRMANSPVNAAFRDPMNPLGGGTIDLTNVRNVNTTWCFRTNGGTDCGAQDRAYDPGLYYRLNKVAGTYQDPTNEANYTMFSTNSAGPFAKAPARTDCAAATCTQAEERQNYANWFTYYRNRNLLARGALVEAFAEATNTFRLGYGRINQANNNSIDGVNTRVIEAGVRDFTAATKTNLFNWLYALPANGGTPLPRAMRAVGEYYSRTDTAGPWSDNPGVANATADKSCRRAYHIMVTDGYWNATTTAVGNSDATDGAVITGTGRSYQYLTTRPYSDAFSDMLADYAMDYWKRDLRTDIDNNVVPSAENPAFWQHMTNFTVGLGVRGTLVPDKLAGGLPNPASDLPALTQAVGTPGAKSWGSDQIDDLWHAALNSRGNFISAKDPTELASAIRESVGGALQRELRESGVATASTILEAGNRKYIPVYRTGAWTGDVQAFALDAFGQVGAQLWNAESKVPAHGSRNIYTWSTDALPAPAAVPFTWAAMGSSNQAALGAVGATHTTALVNYLRGDRSNEGDGLPFRAREGVLGDMINSNPVLLKGLLNMRYDTLPASQGSATYGAFLTAKGARPATLVVGGNDGMLHAFRDTEGAVPSQDGQEVFAFVPKGVYPNLSKLSDKIYGTTVIGMEHQFYVDGPMAEADAYVNAPGGSTPEWRNYLLGSLGAGGRSVFALDVTDTTSLGASTVRWELTNAINGDLGFVSSTIQSGVLPNGEWVAIFGNGNFSDTGKATLFVVNLQTGAAQTLDVDNTGSNGLGGVGVVLNSAGQITNLYAGDLKGKLWKFDYSASAPSRFEISGGTAPFFSATSSALVAQPITQAPIVYNHSLGGNLVIFGTGLLSTETDANNTAVQSIYAVRDQTGDSLPRPMDRTALSSRTISSVAGAGGSTFYSISGSPVNWVTERGWVIDLNTPVGARVIYPPQFVNNKLVLVSAVAPAQNAVVCDASTGSGLNLVIPVEGGLNPSSPMFDVNGDGAYNSSDASVSGYGTNAGGITAVVRSRGMGGMEGARGLIGDDDPGGGGGGRGNCPVGQHPASLQDVASGLPICVDDDPTAAGYPRTLNDRVWRRIINPPIR